MKNLSYHLIILLLLGGIGATTLGCGQKGSLVLPEDEKAEQERLEKKKKARIRPY